MSSLREELQRIYDRDQQLTPGALVQEWEPVTHPFHDRLTWDNTEAAARWRLAEARNLIRSVRVVFKEATETDPAIMVRRFHAVPPAPTLDADAPGRVYRDVTEIGRDPVLSELVKREMQRDIRALIRRYRDVDGFFESLQAAVAATP